MDFQAKAAIVFLLLLAIVLYVKRERLFRQNILSRFVYILMYRTKVGIRFMDNVSKRHPSAVKYAGTAGIFVGFLGMAAIAVLMIKGTYDLFFVPSAMPSVSIVQPFSQNIPGTFFVPFFYLIISIFVLVIVHEFSHGIMARRYGLKIKSSGLAFFAILIPIIPAAFVEPDEQKMVKKPRKEQLSILAAGPFANLLFALLVFGLVALVASPVADAMIDYDGVMVSDLIKEEGKVYPGEKAGMKKGEVINSIDGFDMITVDNLTGFLQNKAPGDAVEIRTNASDYSLVLGENPQNKSVPYLGLYLKQNTRIRPIFQERYGRFTAPVLLWILGLMVWLYALNIGIGLFNLLPIPITDGGRMLQLALERFLEKDKAFRIWKFIAMLFICLIFINIGAGFIK